MRRHMRKSTNCICENKAADQLRSNCEADQHLCFRYMDSTIFLSKSKRISEEFYCEVAQEIFKISSSMH